MAVNVLQADFSSFLGRYRRCQRSPSVDKVLGGGQRIESCLLADIGVDHTEAPGYSTRRSDVTSPNDTACSRHRRPNHRHSHSPLTKAVDGGRAFQAEALPGHVSKPSAART
ncbi:hypothetical protein L1887_59514 [Cichorium endivia]|nr:hypothetical protein L1887_59514 [Cichorium endivia]